jgi:methylglutaconyl-CoA hydratase
MSDNEAVLYERRGPAAWITLNIPEKRNALTTELVAGLRAQIDKANADNAIRAIVLTGNGPAFCAGADLKNKGDMGDSGEKVRNPFIDLLESLRDGAKPVVGAINGAAFGGGLGLVAACDIAIAVAGAKFSFSEVRIGVIPAMISVVVLPKLGEHHTMRLFLTGERFTSERALEYGLLHDVVAEKDLERAVTDEVDAIAKGGPIAIGEAKKLVRTVARLGEDEAFAYAEEVIGRLFTSDEAAEGMAAFAAKRSPAWVKE